MAWVAVDVDHSFDQPPLPTSPYEARRWETTRQKNRLLTGCWDYDLEQRLLKQFGGIRRGAMGPQSKAISLYSRVCQELAVLYNEPPEVMHDEGEVDGLLSDTGELYRAGLWPRMRRVQVHTLGERETLVRVGWSERLNRLTFQRTSAAEVLAWSSPEDPGTPLRLQALRWFPQLGKQGRYAWEVWDIFDQANPIHAVLEFDEADKRYNAGADVTDRTIGEAEYGWVWSRGPREGQPYMPWVMYHAEIPDSLWDPWAWQELVDGALDVACQATHFGHLMFRASWDQKVLVDGEIQGVRPRETVAGSRQDIPADATSALMVKTDTDLRGRGGSARVESWRSKDMREYIESMDAFATMVTDVAGIDAANVMRGSGDAWSGAALSINRDGKREAQAVYGPQFRMADEELIAKAAAIANANLGETFPESGYRVRHRSIPLSPQERTSMREHHKEQVELGMMSKVDAVREQHPGITREQAKKILRRIQAENDEFSTPQPAAAGGAT